MRTQHNPASIHSSAPLQSLGYNSAYDRHFVGERGAGLGTSINAMRREA
jgi:hypothetical protein